MRTTHFVYSLTFVSVMLFNVLAAAEEDEERRYAVVAVSVANMREEPRHAAEMATQCPLGMPLHVRERRSGWYAVPHRKDTKLGLRLAASLR